jgi:hypothetical protein
LDGIGGDWRDRGNGINDISVARNLGRPADLPSQSLRSLGKRLEGVNLLRLNVFAFVLPRSTFASLVGRSTRVGLNFFLGGSLVDFTLVVVVKDSG